MQTPTLAIPCPQRRQTRVASADRSRTAGSGGTRQDRIGGYLILDVIGCGSFSIVHEAYSPFGGRRVAVKLCDRQDREARARIRREAAIGRYLDHPNLTEVLDLGADGSTLYLVQEYLSGRDLADLIRDRQPGRLAEKIDILVQVAGGLAHAHSRGVLHRDVKPSNIRVLDDGQVKIMDFGSAKRPSIDSGLTQIGTILGTLAYMPPECLSGQAPQASSDVYAFGTVGYELLSWRRPFDARRLLSLLHQVQTTSPPPLTEIQPACPSELAEIIHSCLHKAPEERPDFATLEPDLRRLQARLGLHGGESLASPGPEPQCRLEKTAASRRPDSWLPAPSYQLPA